MQWPMNSYVGGINYEIREYSHYGHIYFSRKKNVLSESGTHLLRQK